MSNVLITQGSWTEVIVQKLAALGAQVGVLSRSTQFDKAYRWADRVLLPGGADIHPDWYGQTLTHARPYAPERDRLEYDLADRCLQDHKPLMGICRGHQMIAVAAGGELFQDITACAGFEHNAPQHLVNLVSGSRLARLIGAGQIVANSYHHQAVSILPRGWRVAAMSRDAEIIEAIEHPHLPVISVQWHPEVLNDAASRKLFQAFLELNRPHAKRR